MHDGSTGSLLSRLRCSSAPLPSRLMRHRWKPTKRPWLALYDAGLNKKDFEEAKKYFGPKYIQHNPTAADGIEGFGAFVKFLKEKFPNSRSEIKRVFADGDYVIVHVHAVREPGTRGAAIMDIFRLENGKVVEHWDVRQEIPEKAANDNGMF